MGATITALMLTSNAYAHSISFEGHSYEFIQLDEAISWTDARAAALSMTFNGESGYLVNITSAAEQEFVVNLTPGVWIPSDPLQNDGWIGATDKDVEGDWTWADGPEAGMVFWRGDASGSLVAPFVYENWGSGVDASAEDSNNLY